MVDLILANDCGTSLVKNVYSVGRGQPELLLMPPGLVEVSRDSIESYKSSRLAVPEPHNEAWIELGGKCYAVGFLAEKEFDALIDLRELKYENAIRKIVALVGAIAVAKGLPNKFTVGIASLLPRQEWENRGTFQRGLAEALSDFFFCDRHFWVELQTFVCRPEGGGLVWTRSRRVGSAFRTMIVLTLMLGYRDASVELLERGLSSGYSRKIGMYWMLDRVLKRTSGQELQELLQTIHQVGTAIKPRKFKHLVLSREPEFMAEEEAQIAEAVRVSRLEYWTRLSNWLKSVVPSKIDQVIIGGGSAEYIKPELQSYFSPVPISWAAELSEDVRQAFNLPVTEDNLCLRLADVYGLYRCLQKQVAPSLVDIGKQD